MKYNQVEPLIDNDDVLNVSEYLSSGAWITEHQKTRELENNIKDFVGRKYGIAVPNGTIAIYLSLLGLGLENKRIAVLSMPDGRVLKFEENSYITNEIFLMDVLTDLITIKIGDKDEYEVYMNSQIKPREGN